MIRKTELKDLPLIKVLMESEEGFWHNVWTKDTLSQSFRASNGLAIVYEEESNIIGFVFGYNLGFRGYISALFVKKEHRNKGIARLLLKHIEGRLRKENCELIIADINPKAEVFYDKLGWKKPYAKLYCKRLIKNY